MPNRPPDVEDRETEAAARWVCAALDDPTTAGPEPEVAALDSVVWEALAYSHTLACQMDATLKERFPVMLLNALQTTRSLEASGLWNRGAARFPHVTNTAGPAPAADPQAPQVSLFGRVWMGLALAVLSWCLLLGAAMTLVMIIGFFSS
jgi:hypothetical protein